MRRRVGHGLVTLATAAAAVTGGLLAAPPAVAVPVPSVVAGSVPGATIAATSWVTSRTLQLTVTTTAFDRPELVEVTLPTGYDADPARHWPVTYYLHGTNHDQTTFRSYGGEALSTSYPSLVVTPDGDAGYWSDWYGTGPNGRPLYETFVVDQLIPLVDATFRTLPDRAHRLIMGESMGGWGVAMTAARHPDLFAGAAILSGVVDSSNPLATAAIVASSTFSGGLPGAIYGDPVTQQVRWRGHDPVELAADLRDVDLQLFTGNGVYDPSHGETVAEAAAGCPIEGAVIHPTSVALHQRLLTLGIAHRWVELNWGCHGVAEFNDEISLALQRFTTLLARPATSPGTFSYRSIEPSFGIWGWSVQADPARAPEFLELDDAGPTGLTLSGSGTTTLTTPPWFAGDGRVDVTVGGAVTSCVPDPSGRVTFPVDLGAPSRTPQFTPGHAAATHTATVTLTPHV